MMKHIALMLLLAVAMLPATVWACGGCSQLGISPVSIAQVAARQHVFLGKVIGLEKIYRPEYQALAKEAMQGMHGYGAGKTEIPEFDTKLKIQISKEFKGKLTSQVVELLVKPDFGTQYCNYFQYKNNESYYFFIENDKLETTYYDLVFRANTKNYSKEELGWTEPQILEAIHQHMLQLLDMVQKAPNGKIQKFYDWNQQLDAEGAFVDGNMQGEWTFYHPQYDGKPVQKSASGRYDKGARVGEWWHYNWNTGAAETRVVYENTEKDGQISTYAGDFRTSVESRKDGFLDGKQTHYFPNSLQPYAVYTYSKGALNGEMIVYDATGAISQKGNYKNNQPFGTWETMVGDKKEVHTYDEQGNLVADAQKVD